MLVFFAVLLLQFPISSVTFLLPPASFVYRPPSLSSTSSLSSSSSTTSITFPSPPNFLGSEISEFLIESGAASSVSVVDSNENSKLASSPTAIYGEPDVDYSDSVSSPTFTASASSASSASSLTPCWSASLVKATLSPSTSVSSVSSLLSSFFDVPPSSIASQSTSVEDAVDWITRSQSLNPPSILSLSPSSPPLAVLLPFHDPPDFPHLPLRLSSGPAFGTGDHPTTSLCSTFVYSLTTSLLSEFPSRPLRVLDYGAGSGILGLVSLLAASEYSSLLQSRIDLSEAIVLRNEAQLGSFVSLAEQRIATPAEDLELVDSLELAIAQRELLSSREAVKAFGVEVDPAAVEASVGNVATNGFSPETDFQIFYPMLGTPGGELGSPNLPGSAVGSMDLVVANILKSALVPLAPTLSSFVKEGGTIALSGITEAQAPGVKELYESFGFVGMEIEVEKGWAMLTGVMGELKR